MDELAESIYRETCVLQKFLDMVGASPPRGIVHVGAHHGQEIDEYQVYAPEVLVWIEANPPAYAALQGFLKTWHLPGTSQWCINALISDVDGEMHDFHIAVNTGQASSMFPSTDLQWQRYPKGRSTGEVIRLKTHTLKTVLSDLSLSPSQIDYLVLDTQGAEMKCFGGLGDYMDNLRYITSEVSTTELYAGGAQMHEIDAFLEPRGFVRVTSDPVQFQHGDMLYIRLDMDARQSTAPFSKADHARETAMRAAVNDLIEGINKNLNEHDWSDALVDPEFEDKVFAIQAEYADLLAMRRSRDVCLGLARFSFDQGYKRAFPAFFAALGWR